MKSIKAWLKKQNETERSVIIFMIKGYLLLSILCLLILQLPFLQNHSNRFIDHLFFSVSIVSTTGLAPGNFCDFYNFGGQIVSLIFIQLGGIGYMALSSFIVLKQFSRLPSLSARLLKIEFNLPSKYPFLQFVYSVFIFTLLIETIGAIILYYAFKAEGFNNAIWLAIFHSISAFCTAGFSLFDDSMVTFQHNKLLNTTLMALSLLGSIGFIVLLDLWNKLRSYRNDITLTSKIILIFTFGFCVISTICLFFSDPVLRSLSWEGLGQAAFQSISAHTTVGFNSYDIGQIHNGGVFILIILMVIGASPAGTGGGIKTTSISAIFAVLNSILRRRNRITFLNNEIPATNIYLAISSMIFYTIIFAVGSWVILTLEETRFSFEKIIFEVASGLSTVGMSTGITAELSDLSKLVITFLMFIGRLGVLTFGLALIAEAPMIKFKPKIEDIAI